MTVVWIVLTIALVTAAIAALIWSLARSRRRRRPGWQYPRVVAAPRYPIVLAHGIMGFEEIAIAGRRAAYFRGVAERLQAIGAVVHRPKVPPVGSIELRARALAGFIVGLDAPKVNVIAHSMGGLDARYAISHLGLASRIASLTTIGTPHHGTPLADAVCGVVGAQQLLRRALAACGFPADGIHDVTAAGLEQFNRETKNAPCVAYYSIVCGFDGNTAKFFKPLLPCYYFLHARAGANDGIVPLASQQWGIVIDRLEADHFSEMGWSDSIDAPRLYVRIARELRGRGH
ncbi:MAG: hypothetical protein MUC50_07150 [Myxococcota bacterium]|jgi:triacylglycerol lipase|nr:hypothetical protein [Myxococcota bacterium]